MIYFKNEPVLLFKSPEGEVDCWLASMVNHDIMTQANTLEDLNYALQRDICVHINGYNYLGMIPFDIDPPPIYIEKAWEKGEPIDFPTLEFSTEDGLVFMGTFDARLGKVDRHDR